MGQLSSCGAGFSLPMQAKACTTKYRREAVMADNLDCVDQSSDSSAVLFCWVGDRRREA